MPFPDSTLEKHLDGKSQAMLLNMKLNPRADDPVAADLVAFVPWFNTTSQKFKYYDGDRVLALQYLPQPVKGIITAFPATATEGDRYILKVGHDDVPEIHEYKSGAWVQEPFKDKETVFDTRGSKYIRLGTRLEHQVSTVVASRIPTSSDLDYPLGQEWELEDKSAVYKLVLAEQYGTSSRRENYFYNGGSSNLEKVPETSDGVLWQSFTPDEDGGLDELALRFGGGGGDYLLQVEVFEGVGINGNRIARLLSPHVVTAGFRTFIAEFDPLLGLRGGQQYTWSVSIKVTTTGSNSGVVFILNATNNLPAESNTNDTNAYPFLLDYLPFNNVVWVNLKDLIPKSESEEDLYWSDPILGVFDAADAPTAQGNRYIDSADITKIKVVGGDDEEFLDGASVKSPKGILTRIRNQLNYNVPKVVSDRDPLVGDNNYDEGTEWNNKDTGRAFKLVLNHSLRPLVLGSTLPSSNPNPVEETITSGSGQFFTPEVGGKPLKTSILFKSTDADRNVKILLRKRNPDGSFANVGSSDFVTVPGNSTSAQVVDFPFIGLPVVEKGIEHQIQLNGLVSSAVYVVERDRELFNGKSVTGGGIATTKNLDFSMAIEIESTDAIWMPLEDLIPSVDNNNYSYWVDPILGVFDTADAPVAQRDRYIDSADITKIKVVGGADEDFLDGASVVAGDRIIQRKESVLEDRILKVYRDRTPNTCDKLPFGTEWEYNEKVYKLAGKKEIGTTSQTIGNVVSDVSSYPVATVSDVVELPWQTFTPSVDGLVTRFQLSGIFFGSNSNISFTLRIRNGEGIAGEIVGSELFNLEFTQTTSTPIVTFECPVRVKAGVRYTFSMQRQVGSTGFAARRGGDYIPGERSGQGEEDLLNRIYIDPGTIFNWVDLAKVENSLSTEIEVEFDDSSALLGTTNLQQAINILVSRDKNDRDRPHYSRIISGAQITIAASDPTKLSRAAGQLVLYEEDANKDATWTVKDIPPETIDYPTGLSSASPRFLSIDLASLASQFNVNNISYPLLGQAIGQCEVRGDGTNFTLVIPCYRDDRPTIQSEIAIASGLLNREGVKLVKPDTNIPQFKLSGGDVLATGYSTSGNIEISSKEIAEFSLMFSDGTIYAANETNWDFALYEASTGAASFNTGNDASISTVFIHPVTEEIIVLLWQFQGRLLGNSNVALRYLPSYVPTIPDSLKNGSFIQLGSIIGEADDNHSNRNTVQFVPLIAGSSTGQAANYPLVTRDSLPDPTDGDVLGCILTGTGWRNGFYYRDLDNNKYIRTNSTWRTINSATISSDLTLIEGDYVAINSTGITPVANVLLALSLGDIETSAEIKIKTDGGISPSAMLQLNDPVNTAVSYRDGTGAIQSSTMPFQINESNESFTLFLLDGTWHISRK